MQAKNERKKNCMAPKGVRKSDANNLKDRQKISLVCSNFKILS